MSLVNAVQYTPTLGGTGDFIVSAAVTGFRTPSAAGMVNGFIYSYRAESADLTQWEIGYGTWDSVNNKLVRTTVIANSAGGTSAINFTNPPFVGISLLTAEIRERLNTSRVLYVGASLGAPTISIATPAVVTLNSHGLSAGDRVVFNVPRNTRSCTITAANPAVVTLNAHGLVANQPVQFHATKTLPFPLARNTTYYVVGASITTNTFQVSTTSGGAAISTATGPTATFTNGSSTITLGQNPHNLAVGQIVQFTGTSVVNFANNTDYWIISTPAANTITVSASPIGSAIVSGTVTTNGNMSQAIGLLYCSTVGALPTGITQGTTYFVQTAGLTANAFRIGATFGGADINTSGTVTGAPVYNVWTGNDANDGFAATRGNALFTMQQAYNIAQTYDVGNVGLTIQVCKGTHTDGLSMAAPVLIGAGFFSVQGDSSGVVGAASNYELAPPAGIHCFTLNHPAIFMNVAGLRVTNPGAVSNFGSGVAVFSGTVNVSHMDYGPFTNSGSHLTAAGNGATINHYNNSIVTGGATGGGAAHYGAANLAQLTSNYGEIVVDVPAFVYWALAQTNAMVQQAAAQQGSATGNQWNVSNGAGLDVSGGGATYTPGNIAGTTSSATYGWKI